MTKTREVLIAEWLGFRLAERGGDLFHETYGPKNPDLLPEWLVSPEGEVAMMDRLEQLGWDIFNECNVDESRAVSINMAGDGTGTSMISGEATNRNKALQEAILQMLGKGEWHL